MSSKTAQLEKQVPVDSLCRLGTALTWALGEEGVGSAVERLLREEVELECVTCRMKVSGADLVAADLVDDIAGSARPPKLDRIRLGYCGREECMSKYYTVRLGGCPGIDWDGVWRRAESRVASGVEEGKEPPVPLPTALQRIVVQEWGRFASKPLNLCLVGVVATGLLVAGGFRAYRLFHKPRVFIVSSAAHLPGDESGPRP